MHVLSCIKYTNVMFSARLLNSFIRAIFSYMYVQSNCFHCPIISSCLQLTLEHDGTRVVQCLLKYGTEQIRRMVYKELKGEYGRRNDCEEREKEGVSEKGNVKEDRQDVRKIAGEWEGEKEGERKDGKGMKMGKERECMLMVHVHELMKLLQITFLSCADSSMPSSL